MLVRNMVLCLEREGDTLVGNGVHSGSGEKQSRKLKVGVIFGGRSGEHEISLLSAASVMAAIDKRKYEVIPIGITKEGRWLIGGDPMKALTEGAGAGPSVSPATMLPEPNVGYDEGSSAYREALQVGGPEVRGLESPGSPRQGFNLTQFDVIFPVLHGTYGEDGTIQGFLELAGVPYVGAGVLASSLGMDKVLMKVVFRQVGLPVMDFSQVLRKDWEANPSGVISRIEAEFTYPFFVKPANLGSSVGISKVHSREELGPALDEAARYDRKIIVEANAADCREVECSVLGNDDPIASLPGEIIPGNEFYDYNAKYIDGNSQLIIPAQLPDETIKTIQDYAVRAFRAIDCAGMARVDFFVTRDNRVIVNEINTIPGFTSISMYPKLWEASGIPYPELIERLIQLAIERYRDKARSATSYRS